MSKFEKLWKYIGTAECNYLSLTFDQIEKIAGEPIDHSFLKYKKELEAYSWAVKKIHMKEKIVEFSEAWDVYDAEFKKIKGETLLRCDKVPKGKFHLVVSVILRHVNGSYLLMKRDLEKSCGGKWDFTACGAAKIGESALEAAVRELKEETGISCSELKEVQKGLREEHRMIVVHFFGITDCSKDSVILQKGETIDYKWVTRDELLTIKGSDFSSEHERNIVFELGL